MRNRLPDAVQPFLTWLTARPSMGEAYPERSSTYHVATALLNLSIGVCLSLAFLHMGGWLLAALPVSIILTASAMGKLQAVIYHHCAHRTVFSSRGYNTMAGEAISVVLLLKRFATYKTEHLVHHIAAKQFSEEDEFMQFMRGRLGLEPSMPRGLLRLRLGLSLISPIFHLRLLFGRAKSCFLSEHIALNVISAIYWVLLIGAVYVFGLWVEFAVVWLIPLVPLFQIATAFRILCEHRLPDPSIMASRDKTFIGHATVGVFAGEPVPSRHYKGVNGMAAWLGWWSKMLSVHLFSRLFVLVGDAPAHDFHHRYPGSKKWQNYIQERHKDAVDGCQKYPVNYLECWGLFEAIDQTLASFAAASEMPSSGAETETSLSELLHVQRA